MTQAQRKKQDLVARRKWIKLYPMECLNGSIRYQLTSEERGTWYDLLNFAAICTNHGTISDRDGRPYPHGFIANRLNISLELLGKTLVNCIEEGRITEDEKGIHITNWRLYQSEYDRQKPYRQTKKKIGIPFDAYKEKLHVEYPEFNIDEEWERCQIWFRDNNKKIKSPSLALANWMRKAREIQATRGKNGTHQGDTKESQPGFNKYTSGKYGKLVQH